MIQFRRIHELWFDETVVIRTAKLGEQRQGFDVGGFGRQTVPYLAGLTLEPLLRQPQKPGDDGLAWDLRPRGQKRERRHTRAAAVLVRAPIDDQRFDRLQVSVADGGEHPPPVLRDDISSNVERRLARQRQPSDDVGVGARLTPLGEQVHRVGEEPRLF